jgi:hypothetical protein
LIRALRRTATFWAIPSGDFISRPLLAGCDRSRRSAGSTSDDLYGTFMNLRGISVRYLRTEMSGRRDNGHSLFEDDLKFKYTVWLLCLLLFVAAVDTIPDPPAINPPGSHSFGISALHVRGALTLLEKEWFAASSSSQRVQMFWYWFGLGFDTETVGVCPLPLVHQAADPSPPTFI